MKRFLLLSLVLLCALPAFARQYVSLNGAWQMARATSLEAPPETGWAAFEVPGTIGGWKGEVAWFKRSFTAPPSWQGSRVILKFGGVKWNSRILVNGQRAGGQLNGYDAFEVDISRFVQYGADNELLIGVQDWTATFSPGEPVDLSSAGNAFAARGLPKNRVISPFGGHNGNFGIWDDVTLEIKPFEYIDDVFIKPSVRNRSLTVDCVFTNGMSNLFSGTAGATIYEYGGGREANGQWKIGKPVRALEKRESLRPRQPNIFPQTYFADKLNLEEWTPQNPRLYVVEIRLGADIWRERFGFRELWTQNGAFYFNGKKTHLLASSWWPNAVKPLSHDEVRGQLTALRNANTFVFRTHTQPWPRRWYEIADEVGVMMIPEGALWCDSRVYAIDDERFWKNYGDHLTAMARTLRNHASVVMYSLENEMGHCGGKDMPAMEAGFARMAKLMKAADPTRPITFEADGDPGGQSDVIGIHYPNEYPQKRLWPNDGYWLDTPRKLSLFGPQPWLWKKDKPIYIGEYLWVYQNQTPAAHSIFFGDEAYRDHKTYSTRAKAEAWKMQIQAYRAQDMSGQSPWTMQENGALNETNPTYLAHRDKYRPLAAFFKEYDSRFWAGETVTRTVQVFNDTLKDEPLLRLKWNLREVPQLPPHREVSVANGEKVVALKAGGVLEVPLQIGVPAAREQKTGLLYLELSSNGKTHFQQSWAWQITPRPQSWKLPASNISLFDPQGNLAKTWTQGGAKFKTLTKLDEWNGDGVLVIGPAPAGKKIETGVSAADLQPLAQQNNEGNLPTETQIIGAQSGGQKLWDKIKNGGRVLALEQNRADWLPANLSDQGSTMSFVQLPGHPAIGGLATAELRWWRGDHMVSRNEPTRDAQAGYRPVIVTGGETGVSHAPLLEINYGKGAWLICQMQAASKLENEPAARRLLENALNYLSSYQPPPGEIAVLAPPSFGEKLTRLGLEFTLLTDWNNLQFPAVRALILQADGAAITQNAVPLKAFLQAGGQVFWHRPQAENFNTATKALGLEVQRLNYRGNALRSDVLPRGFENILREDLYWVGAAPAVAWNAATLSTDTAEAIFGEEPKEVQGTTYQAENAPQLEGQLVRAEENEVGFYSGGSAAWKINFPVNGRYALSLFARGTSLDGMFPQVALSLDGKPIGTVHLSQREVRFYNIYFASTAGEHTLKAEFTNDGSSATEDRNLWIDRLVIGAHNAQSPLQNFTDPAALARYPVGNGALILSAIRWDEAGGNQGRANRFAASLFTALGGRSSGPAKGSRLETEKMNPQPNLPWFRRESDHVYMGAGGYIEGPIRVEKAGRYRVEAWGKGTKGAGIYPIVVMELNGREIARVEIRSDDWAPHTATVELPQGEGTLRLRFINDNATAPEDRNLWLDRLELASE